MRAPSTWSAAVALLLAAMAALEWTAAQQETQTYDEATHLAAGYSYLRTGDYHINPEHPPLSKMLAALPLVPLHPDLPAEDPAWGGDQRMFGGVFLYRNRVDPDTMLMAGRAVTMLAALALGLLLAVWVRGRFGNWASLAALFLYVLDANVLAHGRYVTNDVITALFCFAACTAWGAYLERGGRGRLLLAGLVLGLALATKFSAVFLAPVFVVLWGIRWWQGRRVGLRPLAAAGAIGLVVVAMAYGPETVRVLRHPGAMKPLAEAIHHNTLAGETLYRAAKLLHLPAHTWLVGLESAARHDRIGHPAYLLGRSSQTGGWWYYFPVAFAVKAPAALLLLALAAAVLGVRRVARGRLRDVPFPWFVLLVPLAMYGALSLNSRINIGVRHLLPVWPFLLAAATAIVLPALRRRPRVAIAVLAAAAALHLGEAAMIYPHHLAFFNLFTGGPAHGPEYLLDSNIDWGQDILHLRRWLDENGNPPVCLQYFGTADTAHYGVPNTGLPRTSDEAGRAQLDCIGAISVTLLHDLYLEPGAYRWLRQRHPIGHAGWSIYLYDLRRGH